MNPYEAVAVGGLLKKYLCDWFAISRDLEEVCDRMLFRMEPNAKRECVVMLQLVCFAKRSLSREELLTATRYRYNGQGHRHIGAHLRR